MHAGQQPLAGRLTVGDQVVRDQGADLRLRASPGVLERLRTETRPVHERLERRLDLLAPTLTLDRYRRLLERFYGFWSGWEPRAALALDDPAFFDPRRRTFRLEDDLRFFGGSKELLRALPTVHDPLPLGSRAQALGSIYVLEGSPLGGQVIKRHLETALGLRDGRGYWYFVAYGRESSSMWQAFRQYVRRHSSPDMEDEIVRSAALTFQALDQWLCDAG